LISSLHLTVVRAFRNGFADETFEILTLLLLRLTAALSDIITALNCIVGRKQQKLGHAINEMVAQVLHSNFVYIVR